MKINEISNFNPQVQVQVQEELSSDKEFNSDDATKEWWNAYARKIDNF